MYLEPNYFLKAVRNSRVLFTIFSTTATSTISTTSTNTTGTTKNTTITINDDFCIFQLLHVEISASKENIKGVAALIQKPVLPSLSKTKSS